MRRIRRRSLRWGLVVLLILGGACARSSPTSQIDLTTTFGTLERDLAQAMRTRDLAILERLLAQEYTRGVNGVAAREGRTAVLRGMAAAPPLDSVAVRELCVEQRGDTARVVLYFWWRGGEPVLERTDLLADRWIRTDQRWQLHRRTSLDQVGQPRPTACATLRAAWVQEYF